MGKYPLKKLAERYFPANFVSGQRGPSLLHWRTGCAAHCASCYVKCYGTTSLWRRFLVRSSSERCGNSTAAAAATSPAFGALLLMFGCCAGTIVSVAVDRSKKTRSPKSSGGKSLVFRFLRHTIGKWWMSCCCRYAVCWQGWNSCNPRTHRADAAKIRTETNTH